MFRPLGRISWSPNINLATRAALLTLLGISDQEVAKVDAGLGIADKGSYDLVYVERPKEGRLRFSSAAFEFPAG
jgi:hypothetical protein